MPAQPHACRHHDGCHRVLHRPAVITLRNGHSAACMPVRWRAADTLDHSSIVEHPCGGYVTFLISIFMTGCCMPATTKPIAYWAVTGSCLHASSAQVRPKCRCSNADHR
jgi:hypothetical protein